MHAEKCPVCNGSGLVPNGFYIPSMESSTSCMPEMCRSCDGKGWVQVEDTTIPLSDVVFVTNDPMVSEHYKEMEGGHIDNTK